MSKKEINLMVEGGKATAGPPLGPALGPLGINAGQVVAKINEMTKSFAGIKVPVKVIVDTSTKEFEIEVGSPPVAELIKKAAGIEKGHGKAWREGNAGNITFDKVVEIAKSTIGKGLDGLKGRVKEVVGTAKSMGITIDGKEPKVVEKEIEQGKYDSFLAET